MADAGLFAATASEVIPASRSVAGAGFAEAATLSPIEIMHRMSDQWLSGATNAEKAETLRVLLKNDRASASLLRMLEGEMGERVLTLPANKIPKAILKAAGSAKKQAKFTSTLAMLRQIRPNGATPVELRKVFGLTMKAAADAGLPANTLDALRKMGPEKVFRSGPTNIARVYDIATKESSARRLLRWATKGDPTLKGKKILLTGPTSNLAAEVRSQIDELEGMAKSRLSEEVSGAKGAFGKTKAAVGGTASRAAEAINPKGLTAAEEGVAGQLSKSGAKGLGRVSRGLRAAGSVGTLLTIPMRGYEVYDSLVGKAKKSRAALEASRRGGTASVSGELMHDILDKRADLQARRAMLSQDPQLMQQMVQALSGPRAQPKLTKSEAGFGIDMGSQGHSPGQMNKMLDQLLGQMRGM